MRRSPRLVLSALLALGLVLLLSSPALVLAEEVECPGCWRMIPDGPCRCPYCNTPLPGRTCPPEAQRPEQPPAPEVGPAPAPAKVSPPTQPGPEERSGATQPHRHVKRRPAKSGQSKAHTTHAKRPTRPPGAGTSAQPHRHAPATEPAQAEPASGAGTADEGGVDEVDERDERGERADDEESSPAERPARRGEGAEGEGGQGDQPDLLRRGPTFLVGYRYFGMYDWEGGGNGHAFNLEGYPFGRWVPWLRIGLGLDVGFRNLPSHTDWIMNGYASIGFQYPRRVSPYGSFQIGGGTAYRKRFGQGLTDGLLTVGVDFGATFRISRTFVMDLSIGYRYSRFSDLNYHGPNLRVSLGW